MPAPSAPDAVTAAWDHTVAQWDNPTRHDALLALVATYSCYAWAASKYRERVGDPIADQQLDRLRKAATATMLATATARPDRTRTPYSLYVLIAFIILIGVGLVYAQMRAHPPTNTTQQTP
jgi:hypothetical protein